ncbi:unnamed protein product, partial [Porites evermanni]
FGNSVGKNKFRGKSLPTYVYPPSLKAAVREAIGGELGDYPDPQGSAVYHVTLRDLQEAKWPGAKPK